MNSPMCPRLRRATVGLLAPLAFAAACSSPESALSTSVSASRDSSNGASATAARNTPTTAPTNAPTTAAGGKRTTIDSTPLTTEAGDPPAACTLITAADATKAFGEPALPGPQSRDECWWNTPNDLKTVNVIRRTGDLDQWRRGYQNDSWQKNAYGDEGYSGRVLDSIVFRIGDTTYEINVVYSTKGDPRQAVNDLAEIVVSRL